MFHQQEKKGLTERQQRIYDFLRTHRSGVLTSVDPNNKPHGAVIYHYIDKKLKVFFLTRKGTRKYDNLLRDNDVMYVVFDAKSQTVAQVIGQAVEIKDSFQINQIAASVFMTSIRTSVGGVPPIAKLQAGEYVAIRIDPTEIRMASYARPDSGDYDKIFESVESFELTEASD